MKNRNTIPFIGRAHPARKMHTYGWLIIASVSLTQLHAQDSKPAANQARVFKTIGASSEEVEVIGPIDAALDTPLVKRRNGIGDDMAGKLIDRTFADSTHGSDDTREEA